jgi:hypothetical protein
MPFLQRRHTIILHACPIRPIWTAGKPAARPEPTTKPMGPAARSWPADSAAAASCSFPMAFRRLLRCRRTEPNHRRRPVALLPADVNFPVPSFAKSTATAASSLRPVFPALPVPVGRRHRHGLLVGGRQWQPTAAHWPMHERRLRLVGRVGPQGGLCRRRAQPLCAGSAAAQPHTLNE